MAVPKQSKNQYLGGNMLMSTSGRPKKPASAMTIARGKFNGLMSQDPYSAQADVDSVMNADTPYSHLGQQAQGTLTTGMSYGGAGSYGPQDTESIVAQARRQRQMNDFRYGTVGGANMIERFSKLGQNQARRPVHPHGLRFSREQEAQMAQHSQDMAKSAAVLQGAYDRGRVLPNGNRRDPKTGLVTKMENGQIGLSTKYTPEQLQEMSDRQDARIAARREANGGLDSATIRETSRIAALAASGRISQAQAAQQIASYQNRRGNQGNETLQRIADSYRSFRPGQGRDSQSAGATSNPGSKARSLANGQFDLKSQKNAIEDAAKMNSLETDQDLSDAGVLDSFSLAGDFVYEDFVSSLKENGLTQNRINKTIDAANEDEMYAMARGIGRAMRNRHLQDGDQFRSHRQSKKSLKLLNDLNELDLDDRDATTDWFKEIVQAARVDDRKAYRSKEWQTIAGFGM